MKESFVLKTLPYGRLFRTEDSSVRKTSVRKTRLYRKVFRTKKSPVGPEGTLLFLKPELLKHPLPRVCTDTWPQVPCSKKGPQPQELQHLAPSEKRRTTRTKQCQLRSSPGREASREPSQDASRDSFRDASRAASHDASLYVSRVARRLLEKLL